MATIDTSEVRTNLGANHFMWSRGRLDQGTGFLQVNTRTASFTWFGGFTGGVQFALVDANDMIVHVTQARRYGVDGTLVGRSDRTDVWTEVIDPTTLAQVVRMQVFHFWAPKWDSNVDRWVKALMPLAQAIRDFITNVKPAGTGA